MHGQKNDKVARIIEAYTIANPAAVVVRAGDAAIAQRAVPGSGELGEQTGATTCAVGKYDIVVRIEWGEREERALGNDTRISKEDGKPGSES